VNATIAVPSDGAYFEGHFPGRPILPAVALLALVLEALAEEVGRTTSLRAIRFVRLRQPVLPGDRLALTTRAVDGDGVRIDLRRDGALIANGEVILGEPHSRPAAVRAETMTFDPVAEPPQLDALLPHGPPMRFVTSILGEAADGLSCAARIPAACALVSDGGAPALAGLEAAAQSAAMWEALRRWREAGVATPRAGYLVALRDVLLFADRMPADERFVASARLTEAALPLTHYAVEVTRDGARVLSGTIATVLTGERVNWKSLETGGDTPS